MANIQKRGNAYKITAYSGYDTTHWQANQAHHDL